MRAFTHEQILQNMPTAVLLPLGGRLHFKDNLGERDLSKFFAIDWQPVTLYYVAVTKYFLK